MEPRKKIRFSIALKLIFIVASVELTIMLVLHQLKLFSQFPILSVLIDALVLSILITVAFYYLLDKPLKLILMSMFNVEKGNMDVELKIDRSDEIGFLTEYFNNMLIGLKNYKAQLLEAKNYIDNILESMVDSLLVVSLDGKVKTANTASLKFLGYNNYELIGMPITDIFVEKDTEELLNEIEEAAILLSKDFKIVDANNNFLRDVGLGKKDVIGQYCYKITHHIDHICQPLNDKCPIQEALKEYRPCVETHTHINKKGEKYLVNVTAAPIKDRTGEIVYYLHLNRIVRETTETDKDTKNMEFLINKLQTYVETLEMRTLFNQNKLSGLNILSAFRGLEMYCKTKSGNKIPISLSTSIMRDEKGELLGIVCVARDMREIKRLIQKEKEMAAAKATAAIEYKKTEDTEKI